MLSTVVDSTDGRGDVEVDVSAVVAGTASDDPAEGLRAVASLRQLVEELEAQQVARARELGWSWRDVGAALGVSGQAAHKKHRRR